MNVCKQRARDLGRVCLKCVRLAYKTLMNFLEKKKCGHQTVHLSEATLFLKSPTGIKKPQPMKHTTERLQGLYQMLPCLGWCQGQLCATTAVRSPGF